MFFNLNLSFIVTTTFNLSLWSSFNRYLQCRWFRLAHHTSLEPRIRNLSCSISSSFNKPNLKFLEVFLDPDIILNHHIRYLKKAKKHKSHKNLRGRICEDSQNQQIENITLSAGAIFIWLLPINSKYILKRKLFRYWTNSTKSFKNAIWYINRAT